MSSNPRRVMGKKYVTQLTGTCPTEGMTVGGPGCEEAKGLIPFSTPYGVVVDQSDGDVIVGDTGLGVVDVFEPLVLDQYRFVRQLPIDGVSAMGGGEENGDIYVGLRQFSSAGVFLGELTGTPAGAFDRVEGIAVDDEPSSPSFEDVYVGNFVSPFEPKTGGVESGTGSLICSVRTSWFRMSRPLRRRT